MILISSMGGCASTTLISWFSHRVACNCPLNSEGLGARGPGSNPKGLKHRQIPPMSDDKYLLKENSYDRTDISFGRIEKTLFLYDSPYSMVLSLFGRRIAMGHAMAVTGEKPNHGNLLGNFLDNGEDSFGFNKQFDAWTDCGVKRDYKRLIVNFSAIWNHTEYILEFLGVDVSSHIRAFPPKRSREDRFNQLDEESRQRLIFIYGELDDKMKNFPEITLI